ncbi:hypothetical protein C8R44DRAFT_748700 [Mycena epipterygia]|nr:hypothetical protein C8R44DRAFT_748700 [Mycena epipterygia]
MDSSTSETAHFGLNIGRGAACSNCRDAMDPELMLSAINVVFVLQDQAPQRIRTLKSRIRELEDAAAAEGSQIFLHQPYPSPIHASGSGNLHIHNWIELKAPSSVVQEPPAQVVVQFLDSFLARFRNSGYFFLDPHRFSNSALLRLPLGHLDRPSPSLLHVVYLWGCVLSSTLTPVPEDEFLRGALESLPGDIPRFALHPKLVLETIQAEVMISLYYLHAGLPVQGRYHSTAAVSFALSAGLHRLSVPADDPSIRFLLAEPMLPPALGARDKAERINAFWAVTVLNNYWVAADGCPSAIPYGATIDTPWHSNSLGGATITKFLNGNDEDGHSSVALLTKSSILLERIIAFSSRNTTGPPDTTTLNSLDKRLHTFQAALPRLSSDQTLLMAHALTDLAIVRLHAPSTRGSSTARNTCLNAANRIISNLATADVAGLPDPMLGPLCATVSTVYMYEMAALRTGGGGGQARAQYHEFDVRMGSLLNAMAPLAPRSPVIERWMLSAREAYAGLSFPR